MNPNPEISVIAPMFNEAPNVLPLVQEVIAAFAGGSREIEITQDPGAPPRLLMPPVLACPPVVATLPPVAIAPPCATGLSDPLELEQATRVTHAAKRAVTSAEVLRS
jgi:hypothetical protein